MKKILTLSFFLTLATLSQAQFSFDNLKLGIQVSPTISWMNTNDNQIVSDGNRVGLNLGIMGEYFFSENYSFVSGISLISNQGGGLNYNYTGNFLPKSAADRAMTPSATQFDSLAAGTTINYGLQFIEIPFAIRLRTNELFENFKIFAELPVFSVAFTTKGQANIDGPNKVLNDENIASDVSGLNFKWGLGAGAEYSISDNFSLMGGIFYNGTLIDVTKDSGTVIYGTPAEEDSKATIHAITIRIGAIF